MRIVTIKRDIDKVVDMEGRNRVIKTILAPIKDEFSYISNTVNQLIEKYKDVPLMPYIMTDVDRRRLEKNPDYIEDIPTWYVPGYDRAVNDARLEGKISNEFWIRWCNCDKALVRWLNRYCDEFRFYIEE